MPSIDTDYLHDATVSEIRLQIDDDGNRQLRMQLRCDADCGCKDLNGRIVNVIFKDPVIILGALYGHMANEESFDSWNDFVTDDMKRRIATLVASGIAAPKHLVGLGFHSGSTLDVACNEIQFEVSGAE
jgi:hypothetical protein